MMEKEDVTIKYNPERLQVDIDKNEFALSLKTWRLRNGLTQKKAGEMIGCSRYTIMRAEAGDKISWESAYRMFAKLARELEKEGRK